MSHMALFGDDKRSQDKKRHKKRRASPGICTKSAFLPPAKPPETSTTSDVLHGRRPELSSNVLGKESRRRPVQETESDPRNLQPPANGTRALALENAPICAQFSASRPQPRRQLEIANVAGCVGINSVCGTHRPKLLCRLLHLHAGRKAVPAAGRCAVLLVIIRVS